MPLAAATLSYLRGAKGDIDFSLSTDLILILSIKMEIIKKIVLCNAFTLSVSVSVVRDVYR